MKNGEDIRKAARQKIGHIPSLIEMRAFKKGQPKLISNQLTGEIILDFRAVYLFR
jgi:hypothetical protein